jgi:DNA replication protein DnaC
MAGTMIPTLNRSASKSSTDATTTSTVDAPECPLCNGAGYTVIRLLKNGGTVEWGDPQLGKLVECNCGSVKKARTAHLDNELGFEDELKAINWTHVKVLPQQEKAINRLREFISAPKGWVYLWGPYGDGKTTLVALTVNMLRKNGAEVAFANVPQFLRYLRHCIDPRTGEDYEPTLDYIRRVPVLALDDLGAEKTTEWAAEQIYEVLNYRYVKRKPTLVTSNLAPKELPDYDGRLASRLRDVQLVSVMTCGRGDIRRVQR